MGSKSTVPQVRLWYGCGTALLCVLLLFYSETVPQPYHVVRLWYGCGTAVVRLWYGLVRSDFSDFQFLFSFFKTEKQKQQQKNKWKQHPNLLPL